MKKIMNKVNFAIIAMMVAMPAFAENPMCELITKMQGVFRLLRTLAFVGAAFFIAGWAWTYISKAGENKDGIVEDIKKKGISLLVGFALFEQEQTIMELGMGAALLTLIFPVSQFL